MEREGERAHITERERECVREQAKRGREILREQAKKWRGSGKERILQKERESV